MKPRLTPLICLVLIAVSALFLAFTVNAQGGANLRTVTGNDVQIRETPGGKVLDRLQKDTVVGLVLTEGAWSRIVYMRTDGTYGSGWISSTFLGAHKSLLRNNVPPASPRQPSQEPTASLPARCHATYNSGPHSFCLNARVTDFGCREDIVSCGFRSCTADLRLDVAKTYGGGDGYAQVRCDVDVAFTSSDGMSATRSDSTSRYVYTYSGNGSATVSADVSYTNLFSPAVRARVSELRCRISYVHPS